MIHMPTVDRLFSSGHMTNRTLRCMPFPDGLDSYMELNAEDSEWTQPCVSVCATLGFCQALVPRKVVTNLFHV